MSIRKVGFVGALLAGLVLAFVFAPIRVFYKDQRPTWFGRRVNAFMSWWSGLGLPPRIQASLEVQRRTTGLRQSVPVVIATVNGSRYLVSMLGPQSEWVQNVLADQGAAVLKRGAREPVLLVEVPPGERAPVLKEHVRIAPGGRRHFPLGVGAPLEAFIPLAERYPVFRIEPR